MNEKLNNLLKLALEVGGKAAKSLKEVDPAKVRAAIKTTRDVSNQYARDYTGMDAATLLNKYGKAMVAGAGGGAPAQMAVSLLALALRPTDGSHTPASPEQAPTPSPTQAPGLQSDSAFVHETTPRGGPIDANIVGRWRHTWAKGDPISGMSLAVDDWLILNADGACQFGSGRAAGGNAYVGMDTGRSELASGLWRAENKTLYIDGGDGQWSCVGAYIYDQSHLMIKSGGNKVYTRQ